MRSTLASIRHQQGLSQERLAQLTGVPQRTISHLETRGPTQSLRDAVILSKALGHSIEELFEIAVNPDSHRQRRCARASTTGSAANAANQCAPSALDPDTGRCAPSPRVCCTCPTRRVTAEADAEADADASLPERPRT